MDTEIILRRAEPDDAAGIFDIYQHWNKSCIDNDESKKYFVLKNDFTTEQIAQIVNNGYAAVAVDGDLVVSFYFINPFFDTGNLKPREEKIGQMISGGYLPPGRYAISLLSSTHQAYLGRGLNRQTLQLLCELFSTEYDYFAGIMGYNNATTHKSSLKMGWKHYGDVGIGLMAIIGTTTAKHELLADYAGPDKFAQ